MFKILIFWCWMLNKMSCTTWGPGLKMFRKVAELGSWTTLCALFEDVMFPKHISNLPICLGNITRKYYKCLTCLLRSLIGVYYFEVIFKIYSKCWFVNVFAHKYKISVDPHIACCVSTLPHFHEPTCFNACSVSSLSWPPHGDPLHSWSVPCRYRKPFI